MGLTREDVYRVISDPRHKLGVVGSASPTGPQAALVGFAATPDLELIFDTVKSSRKYPNLIADPRCSFVIGLSGEVTVQYEGEARELTDPQELARWKTIYFAAFPDGPSREAWPGISYFVVTPKWIRFSDYGETPPLIEELRF